MEVGRKYFKNDHIQDQNLDVVPEWQISVGRKKFEAGEQASAAKEVADAAEPPEAAGVENEDAQGKEATDDCPQEVD